MICIVVGRKYPTTDKEGRPAEVFDVVIHPSELSVVELDPTLERRIALCQQIIQFTNLSSQESLDSNYSQFKISSNYKTHSQLR
jgi:hypothetical protein